MSKLKSHPLHIENFQAMPGHLIRRVHQISSAMFAEECGSFDLTPVQYAALVAILANPQVDASLVAGLIALDRSTLGDVLERLESKGLILRTSSPNDKRVKLLSLSPEGARLLQRVKAAVGRVQERLLKPLTPRDRALIVRLLIQLTDLHKGSLPAPL